MVDLAAVVQRGSIEADLLAAMVQRGVQWEMEAGNRQMAICVGACIIGTGR